MGQRLLIALTLLGTTQVILEKTHINIMNMENFSQRTVTLFRFGELLERSCTDIIHVERLSALLLFFVCMFRELVWECGKPPRRFHFSTQIL